MIAAVLAAAAAFAIAQAATELPAASPMPSPSPSATPEPVGAAVIRNSGSTNTAPYEIVVSPSGDASIVQFRSASHAMLAAPQTRWLFLKLAQAPALETLAHEPCMKSASFGTTTTIAWRGHASPDLSCPGGDAVTREFARIANVIVTKLGVSTRRPPRRLPL